MEVNFFECIPRAVFDTSTLTGSYVSMNSTGFADEIKVFKVFNGSTVGIDVSYDGTTDHDYFPSGATLIVDLQSNHACNSAYSSGTKTGRKGQIVYGKGSAGVGNLYIIGYK